MLTRAIGSLQRSDFREHPIRALSLRAAWKVRWAVTREPWSLRLPTGQRILVLKSGAGALIYYQGFSEPETADFLLRFLGTGMCFLDVGAHIGEYSLLAAPIVGAAGSVHAFEPNPNFV